MKERPILFSAPMVRAILDGHKTQTRRVVKFAITGPNDPRDTYDWHNSKGEWVAAHGGGYEFSKTNAAMLCPYGHPGDRLWVKESCRAIELDSGLDGVEYIADGAFREIENTQEAANDWLRLSTYRNARSVVVPSIHMPRWASRITLEITDVRVERLQDISNADCAREGAPFSYSGFAPEDAPDWRGWYRALWEAINGPGSWDANPFVWVIEFRRVKP